jgi:uncharacterized protein YkwD
MLLLRIVPLFAFAPLTAACLKSGDLPEEEPRAFASSADAHAIPDDDPAEARASAVDATCRRPAGSDRSRQVCHRWLCESRDASAPARWGGDPSRCSAGELDRDAAERAVRLVNLHRWLAGVGPVTAEPSWSGAAQECALVAHANAKLSHTPPPEWRCWTEGAALASSVSLIANRSAPAAIGVFIEDPGNEATMVHRRWLLSEELAEIGIGTTDRYACVVVDGRSLGEPGPAAAPRTARVAERGWVAWPPAGPVPIDVFEAERLDQIGWTVQSSTDELAGATVTVRSDGEELPVQVTELAPLRGSRGAVRFVPAGWRTEAGKRYEVGVRAGATRIELVVEPIACR